YAGLVTLGHAGLFGIAAYTAAILINDGYGHLVVAAGACLVTVGAAATFAILSLRSSGLGFVMITVALGQIVWGIAYRWISLTNGDNGVSIKARPTPFGLSLTDAPSFYWATFVVFLVTLAAMAIFVASPFGAALRGARDHRAAVSLLQPVHQPAGRRAECVGRGLADGDRRRHRHFARPDRRRRDRHHHEGRRQRLYRALELRPRRHLRADRRVHAGRAGARLRAAVALGDAVP